jgi:3,4-dihydroxy-2-butanone 4-phosphate synthase
MSPITAAVTALANGGMVLVVDDEDRENEGDLIMAAEYASTDAVAFFLEHTSGFLCVAIDEPRADALRLGLMVPDNTEAHRTAFLVSVDYRRGTTSGISAGDRAATIRALADPALDAADLARPGHVMPLLAKPGGVLERPGTHRGRGRPVPPGGAERCGTALRDRHPRPARHDAPRRPRAVGRGARHPDDLHRGTARVARAGRTRRDQVRARVPAHRGR